MTVRRKYNGEEALKKLKEETRAEKLRAKAEIQRLNISRENLEVQIKDLAKQLQDRENSVERGKRNKTKLENQVARLEEQLEEYKSRINDKHKLLRKQLELKERGALKGPSNNNSLEKNNEPKAELVKPKAKQKGVFSRMAPLVQSSKEITLKKSVRKNEIKHVFKVSIGNVVKERADKETQVAEVENCQENVFVLCYDKGELAIDEGEVVQENNDAGGQSENLEKVLARSKTFEILIKSAVDRKEDKESNINNRKAINSSGRNGEESDAAPLTLTLPPIETIEINVISPRSGAAAKESFAEEETRIPRTFDEKRKRRRNAAGEREKLLEELGRKDFNEALRFRYYLQALNTFESLPPVTVERARNIQKEVFKLGSNAGEPLGNASKRKSNANSKRNVEKEQSSNFANDDFVNNSFNEDSDFLLNLSPTARRQRRMSRQDSNLFLDFDPSFDRPKRKLSHLSSGDFATLSRKQSLAAEDAWDSSFNSSSADNSLETHSIDLRKVKKISKSSLAPNPRAMFLLKRILQSPKQFKKCRKANVYQIHRFISTVYQDLLALYKNAMKGLDAPFCLKHKLRDYAYQAMVNKYGIQTVADKKFVQLLLGLAKHSASNVRAKLFATFLGLYPQTEGEFEFYLKGVNYMANLCNIGLATTNTWHSSIQLIAFVRAQDFVKKYFQQKLKAGDYSELKKKLEALTKIASKAKQPVVDIDEVMSLALQNFKFLLGVAQENLKDIFAACDVLLP